MKNLLLVAFMTMSIHGFLCFTQTTNAMSFPPKGEIFLRGNLNTSCIPRSGGTAYLHIEVDANDVPTFERVYRPMNIAIVLDRSGSMADARKIDYAKQAIIALVDRLTSNDYLSIIIYDDKIETLLPTQRVSDKSRIKRLIKEVYPRGSTNLGGGMVEGFRQVQEHMKKNCINRVLLLSDGLANTGITDSRELNRIASRYREQSISLTTMGVGLDYNENLMLGLSQHGGGNYYFIENPHQLASIFERELNGMVTVVAQNARLELDFGSGVTLNDVIGCEWKQEGNIWILPIGDLYANDHRQFTVELYIPEGTGTKHVAAGLLKYEREHRWLEQYPRFSVDVHYTNDAAELLKGKNWDAQAKVDVAVSTRKVEHALQALDAGDRNDAQKELEEAKATLLNSPAMTNSASGAGIMQEQIKQLDEYSRDVKDDTVDIKKAKKSIQYKNYRTQKKK